MSELELLQWVRGPAFEAATVIFAVGIVVRLLEILILGRKTNLAEPRGSEMAGGLRTVFTRSVPDAGSLRRSPLGIIAGYVFHIGLFLIIFLFAPHILVFDEAFGISWPNLPTPVIDATTVVTMLTLLLVLLRRLLHPVLRLLSRPQDYLVWLVTFLPVATGYLAYHRLWLPPPTMIAVHILSVELLMVLFPATKLMHAFTLVLSRWYNGAIAGYRGVQS